VEILGFSLVNVTASLVRCAALFAAATLCAQTNSPVPAAAWLEPGKTVHGALSDHTAVQSYSIELQTGQFFSAVLRTLDGDALVTLQSPNGQTLIAVATVDFPKRAVPILWVAELPGEYRMDVKADAVTSHYELKVQKSRMTTPRDRKHAEAERLYSQAPEVAFKYNYKEAAALYERASALFHEVKDSSSEGAALLKLAVSEDDFQDETKVIAIFQQALKIAKVAKDRRFEGRVLANLGNAHNQLEDHDAAIACYAEASRLFHATGDQRRELVTLFNLSLAYQRASRHEEAIRGGEQALSTARELGDRRIEGNALSALGWSHYEIGHRDQSIAYGLQGLAIEREIKDRGQETWTLINLGVAYQDGSEFEKAIQNYKDALGIAREIKNRRAEATALLNIGWFHQDLGQRDEAVPYFEQALEILREIKDRRREADTLVSLGGIYRERKDYEKALQMHQQALSILREIKDKGFEVIALMEISLVYADLGDQHKVIEYNNQALQVNREVTGTEEVASAFNNLGDAYRHLRDFTKAVSYHTRALALSRTANDPEALTGLMNDWRDAGERRLAVFYGKQAINAMQSLRSSIRHLDKDLQRSFLKKNEKPYHTLTELLIDQGHLAEAEQVLALLKQEEYFDFVRRDSSEESSLDSKASLTPDEANWEKRWREVGGRLMAIGVERAELNSKTNRSPAETHRLAQLEQDLQAGNIAFENTIGEITRHFSALPETKLHIEEIHEKQGFMEDLRELPAGTVAIYTFPGDGRLHSILQTPDAQKAYEYPISDVDLNRKVSAFREAVEDPAIDPRPLGEELYKILVGPMAEDLRQAKAHTLMWSLDGVLRYVPLAALYDGQHYLVEQYAVSVMTLASGPRLKDRPDAEWRVAGFGVTKGYADSPPLPEVASELAAIKGILHGDILLDDKFTETSMREELRKRFPVVHIASHFRLMPGDESKSFLLLGDGTHLSLQELRTLPNLFGGVQLLTLSACNTAIGDGNEVESFGELAQRQGAKAVIASLWPVADESTSNLMQEFYRIRESTPGLTKLEALRQAQLHLLRGAESSPIEATPDGSNSSLSSPFQSSVKTPFSHPFYWAPFFLMGNWL
jgi:CHAT domain-containing protein